MTNQKIKKHKEELVAIITGLNIGNEPMAQRLGKVVEVLKKLKNLADDVGACKYLDASLRDIDQLLSDKTTELLGINKGIADEQKCAKYENIYKEIIHNIHYTLQTEMMLNACISAEESANQSKKSCIWASVAAVTSLISAVAAWIMLFVA